MMQCTIDTLKPLSKLQTILRLGFSVKIQQRFVRLSLANHTLKDNFACITARGTHRTEVGYLGNALSSINY